MKNIKKHYHIKASAEDIFTALTNPLTIEIWTGASAVMEPVAGTEFSLWDGDITGMNLEFEPGKKIVQEWFFEEDEELEADQKSIVTIKLHNDGNSTDVELLHINIPDEAFDNIVEGWDKYYFKPLKELVEE
ncbi:MAG: SRPBCC domain-containing protein [Bacteroidales bacterium]|jgi:activator of HSP90 ATPase